MINAKPLIIGWLALALLAFWYGTKAEAADAQLSWTPPTQNTDGSPLTDLGGYTIYYGPSAGNYLSQQDVPDETATGATVTDLTEGTWYFAVTAYDTSANESALSNEASDTVSVAPNPPTSVIIVVVP